MKVGRRTLDSFLGRGRDLQSERSVLVIAEIAQAHDGSLGLAHSYIEAIARAGADAVKFQTHIAAAESTPEEPWRVKFSPQDHTRYEYWQRMEFTADQWRGLREHAEAEGLLFISSAFSAEAVDMLHEIGVPFWKVASGEITNHMLLQQMADTGLPIILSTGMSTWSELDDATEILRRRQVSFAVLQCTSMYPTPPDKIGINNLDRLRDRYDCAVGLSDHSGTIFPSLVAVSKGASILELHVTFSRDMYGPDVSSSITFDELQTLVRGTRFVEEMIAAPTEKNEVANELETVRSTFGKSLVTREKLQAGTVLTAQHLAAKKPGTGISAADVDKVVGRRLAADAPKNHMLQESDLDAS